MAGDDHSNFAVNLGLYTRSTDVTGSAEGDLWYNTTEGRVKQQADGLTAIAGPHGGHPMVHGVANGWYYANNEAASVTTIGTAQNRAYATPLYPGRKCTLAGLAVKNLVDANGGTRPCRMALYASDVTTGLPGALVADYGTQNATGTSVVMSGWTVSTALLPKPYWVVFVVQAPEASSWVRHQGLSTFAPYITATFPPPMSDNDYFNSVYTDTGFSGAAPATFGAVAGSISSPSIGCKLTQ